MTIGIALCCVFLLFNLQLSAGNLSEDFLTPRYLCAACTSGQAISTALLREDGSQPSSAVRTQDLGIQRDADSHAELADGG
jgi:hypothetical protein